ncbi:MAG: thioesterase family protein [Anaerolineales bacterium]|nr:thioesterase family protein [Anaerolineales bacterium]
MAKSPLVFETQHSINFSDLDPYNHLGTAAYARYYVDHRMTGLREYIGWDLKTLAELPFMVWIRRLEVDFLKPAVGDQRVEITSYVREFKGPDAYIECKMADESGEEISRCLMVVACVSKETNRSMDWPEDTRALFFEDGEA